MRELGISAPTRHPFLAKPTHALPLQSLVCLRAREESSSLPRAPQCHPSPAISGSLLQVVRHATRCAPAKSGQDPASRSMLLPGVLRAAAEDGPPPHSATRLPASQTVERSPLSIPDSQVNQTPACPGKPQTPRVFPAESRPHQRKTPRRGLLARFRPGHTSPSRHRPSAPALLPASRALSFLPGPRRDPRHFPEPPARLPQFGPALQATRDYFSESEMLLVAHR